MRVQSKYQYKAAKLKIKLFDNMLQKKAYEALVIRLIVSEDKYGNKEYNILNNGKCTIFTDFPENELQNFQGQRDNNGSYNSGVSVYSFIPIEAYTTSDALLNKDDILIYKFLRYSIDNVQDSLIQVFQVSNVLSRATNTILYNKYIIAPYTFNMGEYPEIKTIIQDYQNEKIDLDLI